MRRILTLFRKMTIESKVTANSNINIVQRPCHAWQIQIFIKILKILDEKKALFINSGLFLFYVLCFFLVTLCTLPRRLLTHETKMHWNEALLASLLNNWRKIYQNVALYECQPNFIRRSKYFTIFQFATECHFRHEQLNDWNIIWNSGTFVCE